MKKLFSVAVCAAVIGWAGSAMADPTTWTDNIVLNQLVTPANNILNPFSYFHSIADGPNGFNSFVMNPSTGNDTISSYELTVNLSDDRGLISRFDITPEIGTIFTLGGFQSFDLNFSVANPIQGVGVPTGILGRADIYADGTLNVWITSDSILSDFYVASSNLVVRGDNGTAPVPEPTTMLLFGTGLAGLAAVGRRRKA